MYQEAFEIQARLLAKYLMVKLINIHRWFWSKRIAHCWNTYMYVVISYDISEDKRRTKIHNIPQILRSMDAVQFVWMRVNKHAVCQVAIALEQTDRARSR